MAAVVLNRAGKMAQDQGLKLAYHCHGYEFVSSPQGTLFDSMADATDPAFVSFQIDVLHAFLGGADPAALITKYGPRVKSLHLKDLKQGVPVAMGRPSRRTGRTCPSAPVSSTGPPSSAPQRRREFRSIYIEDESADPLGHIPQSVAYSRASRSSRSKEKEPQIFSVISLLAARRCAAEKTIGEICGICGSYLFPTSASNCRRSSSDIG